MKLLFSVIISHTTFFCSKLFGRKKKDSVLPLQDVARNELLTGDENAKDLPTPTSAQIQSAKDFIWEHIPPLTKEWFVHVVQMPEEERHKFYVKGLFLQANYEGGFITNEIAVLTGGEIQQTPNTAPLSQFQYLKAEKP